MLRNDTKGIEFFVLVTDYEGKSGKYKPGYLSDYFTYNHRPEDNGFSEIDNYGPCGNVWQTYGVYGTQNRDYAKLILEKAREAKPTWKFKIAKYKISQERVFCPY